ncbi:carbon-nitrogen hydrolase family protein [Alcaligenes faecalis subsp. faecalis]|uniref:nitrilase n=1 Tax=Alcaligenes faecalis TaxID=511 RepID=UPI001F2C3F59|nr:carbon-nitrogen hydrolase family protein [Alcaligenes faecalis]MBW4790136.1 carbon-nitrogen hydrolase family protein [Alcaligenes faecalis subsp. faecalis]
MQTRKIVRAAAVQAASPNYDLAAGVDKTIELARQARDEGCDLIVFGETWLPGYPFHVWLGAPAWSLKYSARYYANSLSLDSAEFQRIAQAARTLGIFIALGYSERSGGSLYLGQCLIDDKGEMLWSRRKLKPTHVERTVFGEGYARDLIVSDTELGRVGALCCWEHLSPLSKYALYSQHEAIHIAAWPSFSLYSEQAHALSAKVNMAASQIYSVEGQCFTIAASSVVTQETLDMLEVGEHNASLLKVGGGSSMIFAPDGRTLAPYLPHDAEGLIIADLNMEEIAFAKAINDPVGHYSKPEATRLVLDLGHREPMTRVHSKSVIQEETPEPHVQSTAAPVAISQTQDSDTLLVQEPS